MREPIRRCSLIVEKILVIEHIQSFPALQSREERPKGVYGDI